MTKLLTTVAFLTVTAAAPVFAQSYAPEYGSGNIAPNTNQEGEGSYAQAPTNYETGYHHMRKSHKVHPQMKYQTNNE